MYPVCTRRLANAALHPTSRRRHDLRVEHDIVNPGVEGFAIDRHGHTRVRGIGHD
jgi:hypothetical protein